MADTDQKNPEQDTLITPADLRRIADEKEMAEIREDMARRKHIEEEQEHLHAAFLERDILPDAKQRFSNAVRRAVERGEKEFMVLRFPSDWCTDGGRAINNTEPDWPETLTGFAKRGYEYFEKEIAPAGYRLSAQILNFPNGMPGDVEIFVKW
jgi:hypothetical protein